MPIAQEKAKAESPNCIGSSPGAVKPREKEPGRWSGHRDFEVHPLQGTPRKAFPRHRSRYPRGRGRGQGEGGGKGAKRGPPSLPPLPTVQEEKEGKVPPPRGTKTDLDKCLLIASKASGRRGQKGGGGRATRPGPGSGEQTRPASGRKGKNPFGPPQGPSDPGPGLGLPQ